MNKREAEAAIRPEEEPKPASKTISRGPLPEGSAAAEDITFTARDAGEMMRYMRESAGAIKEMRDVTVSLANTAIAELQEMHKRYHSLKSDITANSARIEKLERQFAAIERHLGQEARQDG